MSLKSWIIPIGLAIFWTGCTGIPKGLKPVADFQIDRYLGKWYEIARLDHSFERNLSNVSATYSKATNGDIKVVNRGFDTRKQAWKQIEGRARFINAKHVGSLKVSFFGPFFGGYHILALDHNQYEYAMVVGPSRSYLWILSRSKTLDKEIYADMVSKAEAWGVDTEKLLLVAHDLPDG